MTEGSYMSKPVIPWPRKVRVEAYEEVAVPAGTFMAFTGVSTSPMGWTTQHWLVPSRVDDGRANVASTLMWFLSRRAGATAGGAA